MRARNVKPGLFTNELLAEVPPVGRLLFIGLWCLADREGRLEDRPKRIKVEVLPFDDVDIDELLSQLRQRKFIERYEVNGMRLIQVSAFARHQTPHIREAASTLPGPEYGAPTKGPVPDAEQDAVPCRRVRKPAHQAPDGFETFWQAYPRKAAKRDAQKAWTAIRPDEQLRALITQALGRLKQSEQWQRDGGKFVPYAATWLRGHRWEDQDAGSTAQAPAWEGAI